MNEPVSLPEGYGALPESLNIADLLVTRHVEAGRGERPALHSVDRSITYGELHELVNRTGNALKALGVGRGDRFLIQAPNSIEYAALAFAGVKIGAVPTPVTILFQEAEVGHVIENGGCEIAFAAPGLAGTVRSAGSDLLREVVVLDAGSEDDAGAGDDLPRLSDLVERASAELESERMAPDDLAFAVYTSGTTGPPKGVEFGHRFGVAGLDPVVHVALQYEPADIVLMPQEFSWLYVLGVSIMAPLMAGAQAVIYSGRFDPDRTMEHIERFGVTKFLTVPTVLRMMVGVPGIEDRFDLSSWKAAWCGGERLDDATRREVEGRFGITIYELIGQSEVWLYMSNYPGIPNKPGSLGRLLPGRKAAILDDDGHEVTKPGEPGHVCLSADDPGLALGYRGLEAEWNGRIENGWFYTGDIAYRDEDGYFFFVGRADELIKTRGYRVAPGEVEEATMTHPSVAEAGVLGASDEIQGQRVKAFVVLSAGSEPSEELAQAIADHVRDRIAPYKAPREVAFAESLPKTSTGKIDHAKLKQVASEGRTFLLKSAKER